MAITDGPEALPLALGLAWRLCYPKWFCSPHAAATSCACHEK